MDLVPYPPVDGTQPCATEPDLFFGEDSGGTFHIQAIRLCRTCPFIDACLAYAIDHSEYGVWGGTTFTDRQKMTGRTARRPSTTGTGDQVRVRQRIAELDDGTRTAREIADELRIHPKRVERYRAARRMAARRAAA